MSNTKNINIQLRRDKENELRVIEFLEDKPAKFIVVEALEMYMKAYTAMKEGTATPTKVATKEESKAVDEPVKQLSPTALKLGQVK